ncbi:MAG TPA: hypothetical protein VH083_24415, partial [Myxococcales bacterium]|nr:hypothetical protein [Myxococcales bacterium]
MAVISLYTCLLGASCMGFQIIALIIYLRSRTLRAWMEPFYCFINPLLYLGFFEPAMTPRLPWFRAVLWVIFASYWTVRIFGALLPTPRLLRRGLSHLIWFGCLAVGGRACVSTLTDINPLIVILAMGGFVLLLVPSLMARTQLKVEPPPILDSSRATLACLAMAAVLVADPLLASRPPIPLDRIELAARERGVSSMALQAMTAPRTPLARLVDRMAVEEILEDDRGELGILPAFIDRPLGPLQITASEALLAVRKT